MNLEFIRPVIKYLPEVRLPKRHVPFKEKLIWTSVILALFFVMGNVYPIGVSKVDLPLSYQQFQMIFASTMGSIISIGIGPIVTSSIVLQLLVGAKMIDIDLATTEGKALFQGTQKILTIIIALFEAVAVVVGFRLGEKFLMGQGIEWSLSHPMVTAAIFQIAVGSILLMYMDEIVSKWGIGSGIGLFIVAGVSTSIITGSLSILKWIDPSLGTLGRIPDFINIAMNTGEIDLILLFPVIATIIVFLVVVFGESMRLEIPLSYGGIRGVGGRYPLKFFYVSNIPVILAAALLANVQMLPGLVGVTDMYSPPLDMNPLQQGVMTLVRYVTLGELGGSGNNPGILNPANIGQLIGPNGPDILLHLLIYLLVFLLLCILFGKFWVETTGLGAEKVADQIQQGGMQIPGFRRDKRVVEKVLNRYIPQITIISSMAVGLLAVGADLLGAIGSGTGILLTVGILYRLYEEVQKEQMADMHPAFRRFMGKS
ncbi:MAG: preprotein translocase subunit SecY [Candidatus Altiarchaeota archaeon]|nr:preprotein translocase subunit SecY [Candidatus Altiarchaeota archaeon]